MDWLQMIWNNTVNFVNQEFLGNKCYNWLLLLCCIFLSLLAGKILSSIFDRQSRRMRDKNQFTSMAILLESMSKPIVLFVFSLGLQIGDAFIWMEPDIDLIYKRSVKFLIAISVMWFAFRLVDIVEHMLLKFASRTDTLMDDQIIPVLRKSLRIFIVIVGAMYIISQVFNQNIGALLAGMGIGGLAFALASKDMLSNLFGSVTVFFDKPFKLGDRIKIGGCDGMVEEIGFRSTRIRTLDGHCVTIPNQNMTNSSVENVSSRPYIKRSFTVGVEYCTSPEKLKQAVAIIREMLDARQADFPADRPGRVYFTELAAASLDIGVTYWYVPADWYAFQGFNNDFNMELFERFNQEGISFAFPTQTLYLRKDSEE